MLSVVRNLMDATRGQGIEHTALVNRAFVQTRTPALDLRFSRHLIAERDRLTEYLWRGVASLPELRRLLRAESFDAIHAHGRGPLFLAMLGAVALGRPILFTNHAYARMGPLYRVAAKWPRLSTALLTPNMARHYGIQVQPPKVSLVSACCSDRYFDRPLAVRRERAREPFLRFVGVGNILRWKNWHLLIEALGLCSQAVQNRVRIEVVGPVTQDPESQTYFRELARAVTARSLGERVRFSGPSDNVAGIVSQADWFVLPSTNEPCSVALIEALAMGVPAIASRSGGNVDIVSEGRTGMLFKPDDPAELARCLTQAVSAPPPIASPEEIRESVKSRSASAVAGLYLELYHTIFVREGVAQRPTDE